MTVVAQMSEILEEELITENVVRALELDSPAVCGLFASLSKLAK